MIYGFRLILQSDERYDPPSTQTEGGFEEDYEVGG